MYHPMPARTGGPATSAGKPFRRSARTAVRAMSLLTGAAALTTALTTGLVAGPAAASVPAAPARTASTAGDGGTCRQVDVPVALTSSGARDLHVAGTLCTPATWSQGRSVDVLVHGATYTGAYWDWPVKSDTYSYVRRDLAAGRATFAYDRPGDGRSSRPMSAALTLGRDAYVLHQVISWLRTDQQYATVNAVGHSLGSVVAMTEAAGGYHDVDRLVVTGLLHQAGPVKGLARLLPRAIPAPLDSAWRTAHPGTTVDAGYLTTEEGARETLFYADDPDPEVVAADEARKDVASATELAEAVAQISTPPAANPTRHITAPVLVLTGADDGLFCCTNTSAANETPYYGGAASLTVRTVADTGHDLALSPTAPTTSGVINDWITRTGGAR